VDSSAVCPECGAAGATCQDYFHQLLFWEAEYPDYGSVHHLMVLCYHLQHPSLYSPDGLRYAIQLLVEFVDQGLTPQEARQRHRAEVDSSQRSWKIKGTSAARGAYEHPITWPMTAAEVVTAGADHYCDSVRAWARSTLEALRQSGNLAAP
jgi:hypothetical protein